eukprot:3660253-Rhodomonas_salina.1
MALPAVKSMTTLASNKLNRMVPHLAAYAMPGTEIAYPATRSPVLTELTCMVPPSVSLRDARY